MGIRLYDIYIFTLAALNDFFFVCLNCQCLIKNILVGCYTSGSSCLEHSAVLVFRELFPSPFNGGFQVLSLEEFSQAPTPPPILFFFFHVIFFPFVLFHVDIQLCLTLGNPMNYSTPGLPDHHQLLEFTQTHVPRVSEAIQPCHPLPSHSPSAPNPSQPQRLFQ